MAINIAAPDLIFCSSEGTPLTEEGIATQNGGGLLPTILNVSLIHLPEHSKMNFEVLLPQRTSFSNTAEV